MRGLLSAAVCWCALAGAAQALEVRFYPDGPLYTYELDAPRAVRGLVIQNIAIINDGEAAISLGTVTIDLMAGERLLDRRTLGEPELASFARGGAQMQAAGMIEGLRFQFGGTDLLPAGTRLSDDLSLEPGEAIIVPAQTFAFRGTRDAIRVTANGAEAQAEARIALSTGGTTQTAFAFPLEGRWWLGAGPSMHSHHRWAVMEEFAFDFVQLGADNSSHRGEGLRFRDYYAYGQPVQAAAAGEVIAAVNDVAEDASAMRQRGESVEAYFERLQQDQMARIAQGERGVLGNYVIIDHGNSEYSVYAHLRPGSVRVQQGARVTMGQRIGAVGSSGNSTEPHLHFHVCNGPEPLGCAGIPVRWTNLDFGLDDPPRAPQTGDFLRGGEAP
ncbi:MAG: M23 family metallopeptidase [Hyphomonadaceae bacterium]